MNRSRPDCKWLERVMGNEPSSQERVSHKHAPCISAVNAMMKAIQIADTLVVAAPGTAETGIAWSKVAKYPWCFTPSASR
jgi:hypothetical protein